MGKSQEQINFEENNSMSKISYSGTMLDYSLHLGKDKPDAIYNELINVFGEIILASQSPWPSDAEWRTKFTEKFNRHFQDFTRSQCIQMMSLTNRSEWNNLPWDFGSWLDAIRRRSWRWLGHERRGSIVSVVLAGKYDKHDLEAMEELIIACSCKILRCEAFSN